MSGDFRVKYYRDSYCECPRCRSTMEVYKTRNITPERWIARCATCGKEKKWKTGEEE